MNDYVIKTFTTQRESNMEIAIKYYKQKTDFLLGSIKNKLVSKAKRNLSSIEDLNEIFEKKLQEISKQMGDLETFYNKKIPGTDLQNRIAEYNKTVQKIEEGIEQGFDTISFLGHLQDDTAFANSNALPKTINLSGQAKVLDTMVEGGYETAKAAGGARARLVGEIVEQVVVGMVQGNLNKLFSSITSAGSQQTKNFSGGVTQGKNDMIFSKVKIDFKKLPTKDTVAIVKNKKIELDLVEAVDLEQKDTLNQLEKYASGKRGYIGGMTIKQWSDKVLGTQQATFAHSSYTMDLINERYPNKMITEEFSSRDVFRQYTAYVISRFLVNVIGVYNILVANATGIETTAKWLARLKKDGYALEHMIQLKNSIWTAKDTIYVGKFPKTDLT